MSKNKQAKEKASSNLLEIIRGYSILNAGSREFYFKHMSIMMSYIVDDEYDKYIVSAQKSGIKTEQEIIQHAIANGFWSKINEDEIKSLKWSLDKKRKTKESMTDGLQIISINNSIKKDEEDLNKILEKRNDLIGYSAENFASNKKIQFILKNCLFQDEDLSKLIDENDYGIIIQPFIEKMTHLSDRETLAYAAYENSFFELFLLNYRTPHVLFNKPLFDLTIYQKNILMLANSILNKFKNMNIPDEIQNNPLKILEYTDKKDQETKKTTHGVDDLKLKSAARGGKLIAEDFLS